MLLSAVLVILPVCWPFLWSIVRRRLGLVLSLVSCVWTGVNALPSILARQCPRFLLLLLLTLLVTLIGEWFEYSLVSASRPVILGWFIGLHATAWAELAIVPPSMCVALLVATCSLTAPFPDPSTPALLTFRTSDLVDSSVLVRGNIGWLGRMWLQCLLNCWVMMWARLRRGSRLPLIGIRPVW